MSTYYYMSGRDLGDECDNPECNHTMPHFSIYNFSSMPTTNIVFSRQPYDEFIMRHLQAERWIRVDA